MELAKIKQIKESLPRFSGSGLVEITYRKTPHSRETRPGYLGRILEEIPEQYMGVYKAKPPLVELFTSLDRNQVHQDSIDIRVEDIYSQTKVNIQ